VTRWVSRRSFLSGSALGATVLAKEAAALAPAGLAHASRHWQVQEILFTSAKTHDNPFWDVALFCTFFSPGGATLIVPGYYDGAGTWCVRFTPTTPGTWSYVTNCSTDARLNGRTGSINVSAAAAANPLYRHGGFLKVSADGHYLTYADGTPFFWLADTWWFCPSLLMPFEGTFRSLIDLRRKQGLTVLQMAFLGPLSQSHGTNSLQDQMRARRLDLAYWKGVDRYIAYANDAGILPLIGLAFHSGMDANTLEEWEFLWRYVIARYGAYAVSWFICGEYNVDSDEAERRVAKVLSLGRFIKQMDPYQRAMTVHPWSYGGDKRQAWAEHWYDFIMFQGGHPGHGNVPPASLYTEAWHQQPPRPVLEGECNFEGIHAGDDSREVLPADVRASAYRAIQAGSFGYSYGAHGLWYPTQNAEDKTFSDWGKPIPWWESALRPGAEQMAILRRFYESMEWWRLEPKPVRVAPDIAEGRRPLVKALGNELHVVYFPEGFPLQESAVLEEAQGSFSAEWCDPRNGETRKLPRGVGPQLPPRPNAQDWLLVLRAFR
jgi:Protein of unknown function (DUF4038)/Domain of unknown function (DUF5060)